MIGAFAIGLGCGLSMRSRWSMLVGPAVFMIVFELARLGTNGPTVDRIELGSTYGIIAFVVGRLVHGLLVLSPMVLGAAYGVWLASGRRVSGPGWARALKATVTALLTVALVALVIQIARPGTTAPIVGGTGEPLPGSIAELTSTRIGGHDQALMIRGRSTGDPVLLYLAGGPGGTDLGAMRADAGLEQDFVVVTWEQRGSGKSYAALDPADTLTLEQVVADTVELTNYLRSRFGQDKVYLVGNSWGTIPGVLAVQQHPELFHAFVGTGQMVSPRATDVMFYEDTLAWADDTGNDALAATLRRNGPPPYANLLDYEPALSYEHDWNAYPEFNNDLEMPANLFVPENTLIDQVNGLRAFLDTFSVLYPQLQDTDFRTDVPSLGVPVYVVLGAHEARGRAVLANEWFAGLVAPSKELVMFEHSGHRPVVEEPAVFASLMTRIVDETDPTYRP